MRFDYADSRMPASMSKNGQKYHLIYNQVGTLRAVADTSGNVVKRIDYDTFGNVINDSNPSFQVPFRFAGGLYDKHTELIRFGHRDYDPKTGRWTAKDPIFFAGGDINLYGYCLNDPVNFVDPEGLEWYRQQNDTYDFGREGSWISPGDPTSRFMENNIAHMAQTADIHDEVVDTLYNFNVPDFIANYPTMLPSYTGACSINNLTEYDEKRNNFTIFEIRW